MKKQLFTAVIILSMVAALAGCQTKPAAPAETTAAAGESVEMNKNNIQVEDLMEIIQWPGKTFAELGVADPTDPISCKISGKIFGAAADGSILFSSKGDSKLIEEIIMSTNEANLITLKDKFTELYSGAVDSGMEPYVQSNGGAVQWYEFDAGTTLVRISQGSEAKFAQISIRINPAPVSTGPLKLKEAEPYEHDEELYMEASGYDNGVLEVVITNNGQSDIIIDDEFALYKDSGEGNGSYYSMSRVDVGYMAPPLGDAYNVPAGDAIIVKFDMRDYGKVLPMKYRLKLGDIDLDFELVEE